VRALSDTILLVAVRQTERLANGILAAYAHEAGSLLRYELATVVSTNVCRATNLLDEDLQSWAGKILRF
jgi:hypothetical protein